jgi:hypothetical protein
MPSSRCVTPLHGEGGGPVNPDKAIRLLTTAVVLAVATFAAVVSYSHIYDLGRAHGQSGTAARLLPLSVDGLILAAGLVLLHAARRQATAPGLARWMLWLGITATVGANVSYGRAARRGRVGVAGGRVRRLGRDGNWHGALCPIQPRNRHRKYRSGAGRRRRRERGQDGAGRVHGGW